jgi:phosphatidate cytidylyltransferase
MAVRLLSAAVALPVVLALIFFGGWPFMGLVFVAAGLCLSEFMAMTLPSDRPAQVALTLAGLLFVLAAVTGALAGPGGVGLLGLLLIFVLGFFLFRIGDITTVAARAALGFTGIVWSAGLISATASLRLLPHGEAWLCLACIVSWGADSGGYFAGRFFGKHKLYEQVSPKKTWEGVAGGLVAAVGGVFLWRRLYGAPEVSDLHLAIIGVLGAAMGIVGDLAESLLKRSVGVKDSGTIMPGHGGLFDRVDALMFASAGLFSYAVLVLGHRPTWINLP